MPLFQKQRPLTEGNDLEVTASFEMDVQIRSMKESPLFSPFAEERTIPRFFAVTTLI